MKDRKDFLVETEAFKVLKTDMLETLKKGHETEELSLIEILDVKEFFERKFKKKLMQQQFMFEVLSSLSFTKEVEICLNHSTTFNEFLFLFISSQKIKKDFNATLNRLPESMKKDLGAFED